MGDIKQAMVNDYAVQYSTENADNPLEKIVLPDGTVLTIAGGGTPTGLGALAYKDKASGSFTPSGTVNVDVLINTATKNVLTLSSSGTTPWFSYSSSDHTMTFMPGTMPSFSNTSVVSSVWENTTASFSGTSGTVEVS